MRMVGKIICLTCLLPLIQAVRLETWENEEREYFVTEPHINFHPLRTIDRTKHESLLSDDLIFYSPIARTSTDLKGPDAIGPQIIDSKGELVWSGGRSIKGHAHNFQLCGYLNTAQDHLCWTETTAAQDNNVINQNRILNNTYSPAVEAFTTRGVHRRYPNPCEMKITAEGKSLLTCTHEQRKLDLRPYNGPEEGYVEDSCFQEVDIASREVLFKWCGLDALELWHTYVYLDIAENVANHTGEIFGKGDMREPWDWLHINSVDKHNDGSYTISARNLNQLLKIKGKDSKSSHKPPGSLIWRLGGRINNFQNAEMLDLSRQHHVTLLSATDTTETYSVFNNHFISGEDGLHISNAQIFTLDLSTMSVVSTQKYHNPEGALSLGHGSVQVLPNGNVFVGWGSVPQFTEFAADGRVLLHAHLEKHDETRPWSNMQNYRISRGKWTGHPTTLPKLVVYSRYCTTTSNTPLVAYVSWNGATEITHYRFYTSTVSRSGPWRNAGTFVRTGFETKALLQGALGGRSDFARYTRVEALDRRGRVLGHTWTETFVPRREKLADCDGERCIVPEWFAYDDEWNAVGVCPVVLRMDVKGRLVLLFVLVEGIAWAVSRFLLQ